MTTSDAEDGEAVLGRAGPLEVAGWAGSAE